jgi:hypothetical protein
LQNQAKTKIENTIDSLREVPPIKIIESEDEPNFYRFKFERFKREKNTSSMAVIKNEI